MSKSVLFVCMGNICRSPTGEAVLRSLVDEAGLQEQIRVDSAGTIGYHTGNPADQRMSAAAKRRGYQLLSRARQVSLEDLSEFDLVVAMDRENYQDLRMLAANPSAEVRLLSDFLLEGDQAPELRAWPLDVPDPYYGGEQGFEFVLDMIEAAGPRILGHLRSELE